MRLQTERTRDPVEHANGYVNAAAVSLGTAQRILPAKHPKAKKLARLLAQVEALHDELDGA